MRWRGSSAEQHLCWRRSAVRWPWGRTGPFRRAPAAAPSPSEPGPPLHLRPLGSYISGARGTAAVGAGALKPSVNELLQALVRIATGRHERYTAPAGVHTYDHS
jgi:hypothetical protein